MIGQMLVSLLVKILSEHGLAVAQAAIKWLLEKLGAPVPAALANVNTNILPASVRTELEGVAGVAGPADAGKERPFLAALAKMFTEAAQQVLPALLKIILAQMNAPAQTALSGVGTTGIAQADLELADDVFRACPECQDTATRDTQPVDPQAETGRGSSPQS